MSRDYPDKTLIYIDDAVSLPYAIHVPLTYSNKFYIRQDGGMGYGN